ncbi:MAG: hypothetical protein COZ18_06230 [Flexibacter sp. CG_4_10_14_3_um_filter_32_15]|nr:MAG: hypothetical protein COZ18_06230 [Flexibacter sp. CG_4_10_14_3_um_filter_32_15]
MKNLFILCFLTLVFMSKQSLSYSQGYLKYEFTSAAPSDESIQDRIEQIKTQIPDEALQEKVIQQLKEKMIQSYQINLVFEGEVAVAQNENTKNAPLKVGDEIIYRNTNEPVCTSQSYIFNKAFVVTDSLPTYEVTYTEETKQIGPFKAYKAILKQNEEEVAQVWYTKEISYAHSPLKMYVEDGLVLEILKKDGTKVIFKEFLKVLPKEIPLEKPNKGKTLTQSEFDMLKDEKLKDLQKGGGSTIVIGK